MQRLGWVVVAVCVLVGSAMAQFGAQSKVTPAAEAKFAALPVFPACATLSPANGDFNTGAFVVLLKGTAGCDIPWHWHSANESLMIVGGKARIEMKDMPAHPLAAGDYVYLPAKHAHHFTCSAACTLFVSSDGKFDIHYVDKDGKEIPIEQALKSAAKPAMKKPAKAAEKKGE